MDLIPPLYVRKLAQGNNFRHKSIVVESKAYTFPFSLNMSFTLSFWLRLSCGMRSPQRYGSPGSHLLCKVASGDMFPNSKMVAFLLMCIQCNNQITKTFTIAQLSEHQSKKLIPASKMLNILVAIILLYDTEKLVVV